MLNLQQSGGGGGSSAGVTSLTGDSVVYNNSASTGVVSLSLIAQIKNTFFAGPGSGVNAAPTWRVLVIADLPTSIPNANLANSSITINGDGALLSSPGATALGATAAFTLAAQIANKVFAGPTSGGSVAPTFRSLVALDIPNIAESQVTGLTTDLAAKQATLTGTGLARQTGACTELSGDVSTSGSNVTTIKTSVALAGSPTTTTQSAADNSTKIATTAYADASVAAGPTTFEGAACGAFITPWGTGIYPNETALTTLVTGVTGQVFLIQVTAPITIRKTSFYVQTGQTAANYYSAVYTFAGSLVANSQAKFTATATGQQNVTFGTPFTLAPGMYYYYFCGDTALLAVVSIGVGSNLTPTMLNTNIVRRGTAANGISGAAVPPTLGALTGNNNGRNLMMLEA